MVTRTINFFPLIMWQSNIACTISSELELHSSLMMILPSYQRASIPIFYDGSVTRVARKSLKSVSLQKFINLTVIKNSRSERKYWKGAHLMGKILLANWLAWCWGLGLNILLQVFHINCACFQHLVAKEPLTTGYSPLTWRTRQYTESSKRTWAKLTMRSGKGSLLSPYSFPSKVKLTEGDSHLFNEVHKRKAITWARLS